MERACLYNAFVQNEQKIGMQSAYGLERKNKMINK